MGERKIPADVNRDGRQDQVTITALYPLYPPLAYDMRQPDGSFKRLDKIHKEQMTQVKDEKLRKALEEQQWAERREFRKNFKESYGK